MKILLCKLFGHKWLPVTAEKPGDERFAYIFCGRCDFIKGLRLPDKEMDMVDPAKSIFPKKKKKVEFISEPTRKEVEEAEQPTRLRKFLGKFAKPAKEEEEE